MRSMVFTWYGGRCLSIEERIRGETPRTVLFFPQTKTSRARTLEEKADVLVSEPGAVRPQSGAFIVSGPGEYDVAGFAIRGIALDSRDGEGPVAYIVMSGDASCCVLVMERPFHLRDAEVEAVGDVDVFASAFSDGRDGRAVTALSETIRAVGARLVFPLTANVQTRSALSREFGVEGERAEKFTASAKDIPEEGIRLVFLDAQ